MTTVRFLGAATVVPGGGEDTSCLLINDDCLVDTGWNAAINMTQYGYDPVGVRLLLITHCHHDHYIGLPQLLFYHSMRGKGRANLTIVGPKPDVHMVAERAARFLRDDHFRDLLVPPDIFALQGGDAYEDDRYEIHTASTIHPVVGLCYRIKDKQSGAEIAVTGDTAYHKPLAEHVKGVGLLVHEASRGPVDSDPNAKGGHSGSVDAARIASLGKVRRLALTHYSRNRRDELLSAAQDVFPHTIAPVEGDLIDVS